jgi:serine/threonine protein kinase
MAFSLQDYQIIGEIGQGGFGTVFRARQKSLGREVAIKRLSPQHTQDNTEILRFRREAEAMAALTHDSILTVHDYAFFNGNYYIVMEYVEGIALDTALEIGMSRDCCLFVLAKVSGALKRAHDAGITHRDIKPANILLGNNGQVKLADFGLAMFSTGIARQTMAGSVLGTIGYLAPEALVSPKEADGRVDIFSLGCILYQALAGRVPFPGESIGDISCKILNEEPAPIDAPAGYEEVAALTMRCLNKDRDKRPTIESAHATLQAAIGNRFHALQEELTSIVQTRQPADTKKPIVDQGLGAEKSTLRGRSQLQQWLTIITGVGLVAAAAALVYTLIPQSGTRPAKELPHLSSMNENMTSQSVSSAMKKSARSIARDAPAPLSGPTLEMAPGTIVLTGLSAADSVFVNDKSVAPVRQGSAGAVEVINGYCRVAVKRADGSRIVREIEVLPFQRFVVDLKRERNDNGRDSSR